MQAELQPDTAAHSSRRAFGEDETELGGSVVSEAVWLQKPVGSIPFSRACARVFCSPVWFGKSGTQSSTIIFSILVLLLFSASARNLNSKSALLTSPSSALFTSFFRTNPSRDARFVR